MPGSVWEPKIAELEKSLSGTAEEKQQAMQAAVRAELQNVAVEIMGESGRRWSLDC
jgi:flagellar motor switch protein FliM